MQSNRVTEIIRWFGLDHSKPQDQIEIDIPAPVGGQIILLNGPSGAGKSRLLHRIRQQWKRETNCRWLDLADLELPNHAVVDCFPHSTLEETLLGLNRVGLAEAWDYIRPPIALSEGQKFRLRLAIGLARVGEKSPRLGRGLSSQEISVLACDEFCAILDRITARVVARTLRRTLNNQKNVCAIVATSHDDLVKALQPDILIRCDFGAAEIFGMKECEPRMDTKIESSEH
jgi:ABC-type ATPase with predicted acetyltransferase domain